MLSRDLIDFITAMSSGLVVSNDKLISLRDSISKSELTFGSMSSRYVDSSGVYVFVILLS